MKNTKLSNPFSTGGGGFHFETHVQAFFVLLMLSGGYAPCLPNWPIKKIKLQGKYEGYDTDDLIIYTENPHKKEERKILAQIKHSIRITEKDPIFGEIIQAAWNDFNNNELFSRNKDIIALITGPLSTTDINDTRTILEWARYAENANEFFNKVRLARFSSKKKQSKLQVFKAHLTKSNNNNIVSDQILFEFLRHFYLLGYDLDIKAGVTLSLLYSIIGQYIQTNIPSLWAQLVDEVQSANKNAGTITIETLPEELINIFKQPITSQIPEKFMTSIQMTEKTNWSQHKYATELALANLIGSWNEKNDNDIKILQQLAGENYSSWISKIRKILQLPDTPLSFKNGIWKSNRSRLWDVLGARIFDQNLEVFKSIVVEVLTERDPAFDLPPEERFAVSIYGKVLSYSTAIRKGLAEGLAILGNKSDALINCSSGKVDYIVSKTLREIFNNSDWVLWGSLERLLPYLAEAAPDEFLNAVEIALSSSPCPFDELFSQERGGVTGNNYLSGLLWALEGLAWDERYLVRVCVILGELASIDPGGSWANRPENTLKTILLPWFPQTMATIEKRKIAIQTLCKEQPNICWKLLLRLLPNQHQISMGSHKPLWRNPIPKEWKPKITDEEYWEQVSFYADLAVSLGEKDPLKLSELIDHFDNLPERSFDRLLEILSSETVFNYPEDKRLTIWTHLRKFTTKHRRFSDARWALNDELISKIEAVANKLAPSNPLTLYLSLFSDQDFDLCEENNNWEEQQKKLEKRRQNAIKEILRTHRIKGVIKFAESVESPRQVGYALGCISELKIDSFLLPEFLEKENPKLITFIKGYIWGRHVSKGWRWVDDIDKSGWSITNIAQFLSFLPFNSKTWKRAANWLGKSQKEYWLKTTANPYQAGGQLEYAIEKLLKYKRPYAAINCLNKLLYNKQQPNVDQCIRALLDALSSKETINTIDSYHIINLIKYLQTNSNVSHDELLRIEWAYLPLLDGHLGVFPKLLERQLANDPKFFCEVIQLIYRSKKEERAEPKPSEDLKKVAKNAWRLLFEWKIPPGRMDDKNFDDKHFINWLQQVKDICTESGHLEVAFIHVGKVLIYSPSDPNGLWINQTVAEILNKRDAEYMRRGFRTGIFNSRGIHSIGPTGKPERELAKKYREKAEDIENAGFYRFANTLREIADYYDKEAERVIDEHKKP